MHLTLRKGYRIKLCMELTAVMSHDNYYSRFYRPSCATKKCFCAA
jgi:hypothetical protein